MTIRSRFRLLKDRFDSLPRWLRALVITELEVVGLTLWLITYVPPPYVNPALSTVILNVILYPEHYLALGK